MPRHFGIVTPPVPGHLHPFGALGRELISRGHRVTVLHMADLGERVQREQMEFLPIGHTSRPPGTLENFHREVTRLSGWPAMRYTIDAVEISTRMFCDDLPGAIETAGIDALLVDQMEPAGACVAHRMGIPFVTVCNALALNREPAVPPPFTPWPYNDSLVARSRNRIGYRINDFVLSRVMKTVAEYRRRWNLSFLRSAEQFWSSKLQMCQMAPAFDFPRRELPAQFHYVGPLRRSLPVEGFPWHKLNPDKRLVYASLGTLQNGKEELFRKFAEACAGLDLQLLITHGGGLHPEVSFPGDAVVVPFAPQLEVLARASLTLTHAGLNTVLDSLSCGVPLVAVPITYEQPAIAARVRACGAGLTAPLRKLDAASLRRSILRVIEESAYRENAALVQASIRSAGGVERAADLTLDAIA